MINQNWLRQTPMIIFAGYRPGIRIGHQHLEFAEGDLTFETGIFFSTVFLQDDHRWKIKNAPKPPTSRQCKFPRHPLIGLPVPRLVCRVVDTNSSQETSPRKLDLGPTWSEFLRISSCVRNLINLGTFVWKPCAWGRIEQEPRFQLWKPCKRCLRETLSLDLISGSQVPNKTK